MMDVTPQKLREEQEKGTPMHLVDLQSEHAYTHTHIPGAVNIPLESFETTYADVLKEKTMPVVLYGEFDELGKGSKAAAFLKQQGFTKLGHVLGGLRAWQEAGFRTEGGDEA